MSTTYLKNTDLPDDVGFSAKSGADQRKALKVIRNHPVKPRNVPGSQKKVLTVTLTSDDDVEMESHELVGVKEDVCQSQSQGQIPEGVTDIDSGEDQGSPQQCAEYASAIYSYLRQLEDSLSIRQGFLQG